MTRGCRPRLLGDIYPLLLLSSGGEVHLLQTPPLFPFFPLLLAVCKIAEVESIGDSRILAVPGQVTVKTKEDGRLRITTCANRSAHMLKTTDVMD